MDGGGSRIWLACGKTGEFEERRGWVAAAFTDPIAAASWCFHANRWLRYHFAHTSEPPFTSERPDDEEREQLEKICHFDPRIRITYSGTEYHVIDAPLNPPTTL